MSEEWRLQARCRGIDLSVFFPTGGDTYTAAEAVCASCPVRDACLADALRVFDVDGYRGGKTGEERAVMVRNERSRKAVGERLNADILRLHARGWSSELIGKQLGVSREAVWRRVSAARKNGAVA